MRVVLINLERARVRRERMSAAFARTGIEFEIWPAVDARALTEEDRGLVDQDARRRLGLYPIPDGSLANTLSQRAAMQDLIDHGPEMMAVFEDDATFDDSLPAVLSALEECDDLFDVVILQRRNPRRAFVPCLSLSTGHTLGRVRFADYGSNGYVITRDAARRFLERTSRMVREIDQALSRFWDNGLNVLYVHPPVVSHDRGLESQIEETRHPSRFAHRSARRTPIVLARRLATAVSRDVRRRIIFRRLLRTDRVKFGEPPPYPPTEGLPGSSERSGEPVRLDD